MTVADLFIIADDGARLVPVPGGPGSRAPRAAPPPPPVVRCSFCTTELRGEHEAHTCRCACGGEVPAWVLDEHRRPTCATCLGVIEYADGFLQQTERDKR